jgi:hypothetical protein
MHLYLSQPLPTAPHRLAASVHGPSVFLSLSLSLCLARSLSISFTWPHSASTSGAHTCIGLFVASILLLSSAAEVRVFAPRQFLSGLECISFEMGQTKRERGGGCVCVCVYVVVERTSESLCERERRERECVWLCRCVHMCIWLYARVRECECVSVRTSRGSWRERVCVWVVFGEGEYMRVYKCAVVLLVLHIETVLVSLCCSHSVASLSFVLPDVNNITHCPLKQSQETHRQQSRSRPPPPHAHAYYVCYL